MRNAKSGFTLVEIMFVVFIISFLLIIAIVQGVKLRKMANESNAQANLKSIAASFEIYAAGHAGAYSPDNDEANLQFLVDAKCAPQDFITIGQVGHFRYIPGSIEQGGYDIRAIAVSEALSDHNYQIITGGLIKRSDSANPGDTEFKIYN
jgi:prepilin-type N-terminal cleavage/methylation domain-containing protein